MRSMPSDTLGPLRRRFRGEGSIVGGRVKAGTSKGVFAAWAPRATVTVPGTVAVMASPRSRGASDVILLVGEMLIAVVGRAFGVLGALAASCRPPSTPQIWASNLFHGRGHDLSALFHSLRGALEAADNVRSTLTVTVQRVRKVLCGVCMLV